MLGEPFDLSGSDTAAPWVFREIDLQQDVECRHPVSRCVKGIGKPRPVERVHDGCGRPDGTRLVRLGLPDEVPRQILTVTYLAHLLGELLLAVLADVANPEIAEFPHDGCRMELGHHDPRQGARIAARCMRSVRDPGVDLGEPVGEVTHC